MLHQRSTTRQVEDRGAAAAGARSLPTEEAARGAVALIGQESPPRPGLGGAGRPTVDLAGALGRLGEAFGQLRTALGGVDERVEALQGTVDRTTSGLDTLRERIALEDARRASLHQRIATLEARQMATLDEIQRRIADMNRQVSIALAVAMLLAALAIVALFVLR